MSWFLVLPNGNISGKKIICKSFIQISFLSARYSLNSVDELNCSMFIRCSLNHWISKMFNEAKWISSNIKIICHILYTIETFGTHSL